jgi:ribonucleoside-triphosphate reductase (thioredoxin)
VNGVVGCILYITLGLWAMGSPLTEERGLFAALNNCAFVSTENMWDDQYSVSTPFTFLMDAAMLG